MNDFIQAIKNNPDDDAPRLIYADWLEEQGDTNQADFIRASIELYNMDDVGDEYDREKRSELISTIASIVDNNPKWIYAPIDCKGDYSWNGLYSRDVQITLHLYRPEEMVFTNSRGFTKNIACNLWIWEKYGKEILKIHPISSYFLGQSRPLFSEGYYCWYCGMNQHFPRSSVPESIFHKMMEYTHDSEFILFTTSGSHCRIGCKSSDVAVNLATKAAWRFICE